jgi:uncharacterized protein YecT (DUF1311 family)
MLGALHQHRRLASFTRCSMSAAWSVFALLALSAPGAAQESGAAAACDKLATIAQSGCLEKLANAADAKLNEVYRRAVKTIESSDPDHAAAWKAELKKAQQAWIAFRDADCGALTAYEWSHGTGMGAATEHCILEKTEARTRDLASRYSGR